MKRGNIMRLRTFYLVIHAAFLSALAVPQLASAADDDFRDSLVQTVIDKWQNTSEATSSPRWESGMKAWLEQRSTDELDAAIQLDSYDSLTDLLLSDPVVGLDGALVAVGKLYYSLEPCRLVDTRSAIPPYIGPIPEATTYSFHAKDAVEIPKQGGDAAGCAVPATATALVVNITSAGTLVNGHLRAYPHLGALPTASILNFTAGVNLANSTILPVCEGTCPFDFDIYAFKASEVIIDVMGYFAD